ncbi:hypothetical protein GCM10014715_47940 [Streptomyces spiralis]|uniref:Uncharacterized protein n=1 Tax=Streptomyces spiralis TaxID=66376 RepID=A0A919A4J0_9ACTN|nr:hypothetical protein GCM10014715_47940 [Streptomyces spiralis]
MRIRTSNTTPPAGPIATASHLSAAAALTTQATEHPGRRPDGGPRLRTGPPTMATAAPPEP